MKPASRPQPFGPFPKGRRGLVEKSSLIRHSSGGQVQRQDSRQAAAVYEQRNTTSTENQVFLKEVRPGRVGD